LLICHRNLETFASRNSVYFSKCSSVIRLLLNFVLISFLKTFQIETADEQRHFASWQWLGGLRFYNADLTFLTNPGIRLFRLTTCLMDCWRNGDNIGFICNSFHRSKGQHKYTKCFPNYGMFGEFRISDDLREKQKKWLPRFSGL